MTKTYTHLFFDLDHTLWDFDSNAKLSIAELYDRMDIERLTGIVLTDFYTSYLIHNKLLWGRYEKGFMSAEDLKWKRMWRTLLEYKVADEQLAKAMSTTFLEILPTQSGVFEHTFELLDYLQQKNYNLHLITNGFEKVQWSKLKHSKLDNYFKHVITSEASNSMKPKKEIFDFALRKTGAELSESLMLGDNLGADIKGALDAGMDCVFVNHINEPCHLKPTYTITHLKDLLQIL